MLTDLANFYYYRVVLKNDMENKLIWVQMVELVVAFQPFLNSLHILG